MNRLPDSIVIYTGGPYVFCVRDGLPFLSVSGREYALTCHPYEPCLYITGPDGERAAVHNSFDPLVVAEVFLEGRTTRSITGREYGPEDFCRMTEYACSRGDITIDEAEKVFEGEKAPDTAEQKEETDSVEETPRDAPAPEGQVITGDPFYSVAAEYPDTAVEYCLVAIPHTGNDETDHRMALFAAAGKLFFDEVGERVWTGSPEKAAGNPIVPEALFAPVTEAMSYRKAFLCPPWGSVYEDMDFDRVNAALFPAGSDRLTVYEWTCDWSDYFDEGHEWWGALCLTVYDRTLDRFVIILASATD